jgi:hypothetical protein
MTVDLAEVDSGHLSKSAWVFSQGSTMPIATFTLTADVRPIVLFSPAALDFGSVLTGLPAVRTFEARIDRRVIDAADWPNMVCSDDRMTLRRIPAVQGDSGTTADSDGYQHVRYEVKLSAERRSGILSGTIRAAIDGAPDGHGAPLYGKTLPAPVRDVLRKVAVTFRAELVGAIRARPSFVAFGVVSKGQKASRVIVVEMVSPQAPKSDIAVKCACASVSVQVLPIGGHGTWFFQITLEGDAPPGLFESELQFEDAAGSRLLVPLRAYIVTGGGVDADHG